MHPSRNNKNGRSCFQSILDDGGGGGTHFSARFDLEFVRIGTCFAGCLLRAGIDSADPGPFSYEEINWTSSSHEWWRAWGGRGNGGEGGRAPNDEQQPPDAEDPASLPEALRSEPKHYHHWLPRGAEVSKRPKFTHQRDKLQEAGRFLKVPWPAFMWLCFPQQGQIGSRGSQLFVCLTKRQSMARQNLKSTN